ncbi:hypothetical protein [Corynebacterium glyciniphilum]|uniref:hypothetical protein n=1 Tax=Corynebacterium glyciniphilum TaxID=1404244 RepID=UPI0011AB2F38|nr:hypothetical protein [Corynebacterium glyciniphilum]
MSTPLNNAAKDNHNETVYVLHARPLRPGTDITETARYADDEWPLAPAAIQGQQRGLTLRFNTVTDVYQEALKKFAYTGLSGDLPFDEERPSIGTIVSHYYNLAVFLRWLTEHHKSPRLDGISEEILRSYQQYILTTYRSATRRNMLRSAVVFLWRYRCGLGPDALSFDPRLINGWKERYAAPAENTTPRIPEEVHSRLLIWSLRFVDNFAEDILQAISIWDRRRQRSAGASGPRGTALKNLQEFLAKSRKEHQPLPGVNGNLNTIALSRIIGCDRSVITRHIDQVSETISIVGVSDYAALGVDVTGHLEAAPWIEGVSLDPARDDSLTVLTQMLQAACYILVAFLSGMRDSEVKHLRTGCCQTHLGGDGQPYRWTVTSRAFKGEQDPTGVTATWVIGGPAARAISVLERVHQQRGHGHTDWLFAPVKTGPGTGSAGRGGNPAMTSAGSNRQLNRFIAWVNSYCDRRNRNDPIPDVDGKPWVLSTAQFRRTLAWYIARRPGGSIAGAIAYRHHSIQMFEGYAGTSESGFRAEVEAEEALARGEELLALIDRNEHTELAGPAAGEARRRLEAMQHNPAFLGTVSTDRHRFLRLITHNGPSVYPGKYVTCVYTKERALCRSASPDPEDVPDMSNCKPLTCRNVALTGENIKTWREELHKLDGILASPGLLPPALGARLTTRREKVASYLSRHQETQ